MDSYADQHFSQQSARQQQQWGPHLIHQPPFPSPPAGDYPPFYAQQPPSQPNNQQPNGPNSSAAAAQEQMSHLNRASSQLSLNLSSLSVTSPTNHSPITGPSAASALSPVTPISPSGNPFHHHHGNISSQFQFSPPDPNGSASQQNGAGQSQQQQQQGTPYDDQSDTRRTPAGSRSSSASSQQLPRKRSFTSGSIPPPPPVVTNLGGPPLVEDSMYDDGTDAAMDLSSGDASQYDDLGIRTTPYPSSQNGANGGGGNSPIDGGSTSGGEDVMGGHLGTSNGGAPGMSSGGMGAPGGVGGSMNILGKPMATNNFVTKLYQMISDSKSAHFIAWTELGTSFVVSNVGEFSRTILGSHFKHNNFSSFVRQLNMYGFHKINRTPRAQRTSTDAQTWEFSHHKFLRGRPDLLDEIKRKALEPDPAMKHRVELPGEVAAQLNAMRDENRRLWEQLDRERRKVEKLVGVVGRVYDVVGKTFGGLPPFPSDLLADESPNIYITTPQSTTSRYPPPLSMNLSSQASLHSLHSLSSPNSSPTTADFPSHMGGPTGPPSHPSLSRQHSFQHVSFSRADGNSSASTPLPPSPGSISMELFDEGDHSPSGRSSNKRQRMDDNGMGISINGNVNGVNGNGVHNGDSHPHSLSAMSSPVSGPGMGGGLPAGLGGMVGVGPQGKKLNRARSDSAPLGYGGFGLTTPAWGATGPSTGGIVGRPRSGSGMAGRGIPNIGSLARGGGVGPTTGTPLLTLSTVPSGSPAR